MRGLLVVCEASIGIVLPHLPLLPLLALFGRPLESSQALVRLSLLLDLLPLELLLFLVLQALLLFLPVRGQLLFPVLFDHFAMIQLSSFILISSGATGKKLNKNIKKKTTTMNEQKIFILLPVSFEADANALGVHSSLPRRLHRFAYSCLVVARIFSLLVCVLLFLFNFIYKKFM